MNKELKKGNVLLKNYSVRAATDEKIPTVVIEGVEDLDVGKIFDCGQCFRFDPVENSPHEKEFAGVAFGRFVSFAQEGDTLYIYNSTADDFESVWYPFLSLDCDYSVMTEDILSRSDKEALRLAVNYGQGIRILRQDEWETVCSFIISQQNNIPRIKKIVESLSRRLGTPISAPGMEEHGGRSDGIAYAFPTPQAVFDAGEDVLAELKTGFRAKYILDAARRVLDGSLDFDFLRNCDDLDQCRKHLLSVRGIGDKVANCSLLFGFEKLNAFPVDVWIRRVIQKYFPENYDPSELGAYAGLAQQYLFYYERYINN